MLFGNIIIPLTMVKELCDGLATVINSSWVRLQQRRDPEKKEVSLGNAWKIKGKLNRIE